MAGQDLIERFVERRFVPQGGRAPFACPIRKIVLADSLDGAEQALVRVLLPGASLAVVSDQNTSEVLGRRIERALGAPGVVLERPQADEITADRLTEQARHADALVAVGSGTLNDLCKHVGHRTGRPCVVFATAPSMNGYTTSTVSISRGGYKHSLAATAPLGVFLDLTVLAAAPARMIRAGLGDVLCRSTAQVDWLLAHLLLGTAYAEDPFTIQAADEKILLDRTGGLAQGDPDVIRALARLLVLGGLGMLLVGSSHPGSGGEHAISHYLDMLLRPHPGSLHGEQVGVASRTMARLQSEILARDEPPRVAPQRIDAAAMRRRYGPLADDCLAAMRAAGAATAPDEIGIDPAFYRAAVLHAREIRARYSMLDLAADAGLLESLVDALPQAAGSSNSAVDR